MKECSGIPRGIYACALFQSSKFFSINSKIMFSKIAKESSKDVIISFSNVHICLNSVCGFFCII